MASIRRAYVLPSVCVNRHCVSHLLWLAANVAMENWNAIHPDFHIRSGVRSLHTQARVYRCLGIIVYTNLLHGC